MRSFAFCQQGDILADRQTETPVPAALDANVYPEAQTCIRAGCTGLIRLAGAWRVRRLSELRLSSRAICIGEIGAVAPQACGFLFGIKRRLTSLTGRL